MRWSSFIFLVWFFALPACEDQSKLPDEANLTSEAEPSAEDLLSALILPDTATLSSGKTFSFESLGMLPYQKSLSITTRGAWSIADPQVLGFHEAGTPGRFRARSPGTTLIHYRYEGIEDSALVTVSEKILETLQLSKQELRVQLEGVQGSYISSELSVRAIGIYSDGSTEDLTEDAIWSSEDEARLATIGNGVFRALAPTTTSIRLKVNDIESSIPAVITSVDRQFVGFTISPSPLILPLQSEMPIQIRANYSNGESILVTSESSLTLGDPSKALATMGTQPQLRGLALGASELLVSYEGTTRSYPVLVVENEAMELKILSPSRNFMFSLGQQENFQAALLYSDGSLQDVTSLVSWKSDNTTILAPGSVEEEYGAFTAAKVGTAAITGSFGAFSTTKAVTVNIASLVSLDISSTESGDIGQFTSRSYTVKGTYTNAVVRVLTGSDVSWSYIRAGTETSLGATGRLEAGATAIQGPLTLKVSSSGISQTLTVTVGVPVPVALAITPATDATSIDRSLAAGPVQLVATSTYSDGSTVDSTQTATWTYDISTTPNTQAGYVRNETGFKGQLTPLATGRFQVTASFAGISQTMIVRVNP